MPAAFEEGSLVGEQPTFEETYPKYAFSELVRLGIALGGILRTLRRADAVGDSLIAPGVDPTPIGATNETAAG